MSLADQAIPQFPTPTLYQRVLGHAQQTVYLASSIVGVALSLAMLAFVVKQAWGLDLRAEWQALRKQRQEKERIDREAERILNSGDC